MAFFYSNSSFLHLNGEFNQWHQTQTAKMFLHCGVRHIFSRSLIHLILFSQAVVHRNRSAIKKALSIVPKHSCLSFPIVFSGFIFYSFLKNSVSTFGRFANDRCGFRLDSPYFCVRGLTRTPRRRRKKKVFFVASFDDSRATQRKQTKPVRFPDGWQHLRTFKTLLLRLFSLPQSLC